MRINVTEKTVKIGFINLYAVVIKSGKDLCYTQKIENITYGEEAYGA
ncbi:hypothetical protein MASR2M15_00670 [Anaerolineales bacterium]